MKRNFNFLIDAFENLSGRYKFGVFIHENNWETFNKSFDNALKITPLYFAEGIMFRRVLNDNCGGYRQCTLYYY